MNWSSHFFFFVLFKSSEIPIEMKKTNLNILKMVERGVQLNIQCAVLCSVILLKGNAACIQESFLINIKIKCFPTK